MWLRLSWLPLLAIGLSVLSIDARRVRIEEPAEDETIQYYAAEPQDDEEVQPRRVVLVSSDQYNGYYGQPTAASRSSAQDNYIPQTRKVISANSVSARGKESKSPPIQTIRNYNKVNDDGSFTFGYEAADGSFKEETRGTDCVVRGKYGYVDPDGNKREFTYVSGNPCDPNAPKEEEEELPEREPEGPANYPTRPIRPVRPVTVAPKPAVTLFQNNYSQTEEEQPEPEQILRAQPIRRPTYIARPQYEEESVSERQHIHLRPQIIQPTTPSYVPKHTLSSVSITPRPVTPTPAPRTQLPATTYKPQLLQVSVTPRPSILQVKTPSTTALPIRGNLDFDNEFQRFQQENNVIGPVKTTPKATKSATPSTVGNSPVYSSALVFDPTSGQYNTQLYQALPQTEGDFTLNQRIQPYVHQQQRPVINYAQLQQQSPLYVKPAASQNTYQQQQAGLQFQNSAHLFAQQQRTRLQQQQQQQRQPEPEQHPVYYVQPGQVDGALGSSQIDAFLRGHNIQF